MRRSRMGSVVPFYSLANGFLTGKYRSKDDLDKSPRGLRNIDYLEGRGPAVLEALDQMAAETGAALATVALAWTNAQPGIAAALASATSVEQLKELTAALQPEADRRADRPARRGERLASVREAGECPRVRSAHS